MSFELSTSVIYITPEHDEVYTFIKEIDDKQGLYTLDFNNVIVPENKIKVNTHTNFSVPSIMTKNRIINYHYERLIDGIVRFLIDHNPAEDLMKIYRKNEVIYFEPVVGDSETPDDKEHFRELTDKLNKLIGVANSAIKSRFNKHIVVILNHPPKTHHLHTIRV